MVYQPWFVSAARRFVAAVRQQHAPKATAAEGAPPVRILGTHWRRGDFAINRGTSHESECVDVATGAEVQPCVQHPIVLSAVELAASLRPRLAATSPTILFLATDAKPAEVEQLRKALPGTSIVRYEGESTPHPAADYPRLPNDKPTRAIMDTLICALSDAFVGTRRSMFTWNILEERIVHGQPPETGGFM